MTNGKDFMDKFMEDLKNIKINNENLNKSIVETNLKMKELTKVVDNFQKKIVEQELSDLKDFLSDEEFQIVLQNEIDDRNKEISMMAKNAYNKKYLNK